MYKIFTLIFCISLFGFAEPIKFNEEKYINVIQTSIYKNGLLNINKDNMEITYPSEGKSLVFNSNNIVEKTKSEEKILTYEENLELTIFSKIIKGIYLNQLDDLKEYFEIKSEDKKIVLIPNEYIANAINKIVFQKENSKLAFLKIYFSNDDWINIVENN